MTMIFPVRLNGLGTGKALVISRDKTHGSVCISRDGIRTDIETRECEGKDLPSDLKQRDAV